MIYRRVGRVDIGETSVVIAISGPHRAAALTACHEAIDELEVPCRSGSKRSTKAARSGSAEGPSGSPVTSPSERLAAVQALHAREGGLLARSSLFDLVADDVEWHVLGSPDELPWAGTFHGREGVRRWMETLDEHMEYERFEPVEFFADGDTVIEIVFAGGRARATGRSFQSEVVRIWRFHEGKAVRVRSFYDTGAYERAFRP